MEFFLTLTFLFAVGAFCGWVIELIFRRLTVKNGLIRDFCTGRICLYMAAGWYCSFSLLVFRSAEFRPYGCATSCF